MIRNLREIIKNNISEAVGVPHNIYKTATEAYILLFEEIKNVDLNGLESKDGETFNLRSKFSISDYEFNNIKFTIKIIKTSKLEPNEFVISRTSISSEFLSPGKNDIKRETKAYDYLTMISIIYAPIDYTKEELLNFIDTSKNNLISTLAHELKHGYDHYKMEYESAYERAKYESSARRSFRIDAVDKFFHYLYYITITESLVRPTEVLADLLSNKINQKEFLKFLLTTDTYKTLKRISNFTLEGFKNELMGEMKQINKFFEAMNIDDTTMTDEDKVNEILKLIYINITNWKADSFKDLIRGGFEELIFGVSEKKEKIFQKFINSIQKYKTPEAFFEHEANNFREVATKMIKKISKVYDLLESGNPPKATSRRRLK